MTVEAGSEARFAGHSLFLVNFHPAAANTNREQHTVRASDIMHVQTWPWWRHRKKMRIGPIGFGSRGRHGGVRDAGFGSAGRALGTRRRTDRAGGRRMRPRMALDALGRLPSELGWPAARPAMLLDARLVGPRVSLVIAAQSTPAGVLHPAGMLAY
jgi:hypothetical protein